MLTLRLPVVTLGRTYMAAWLHSVTLNFLLQWVNIISVWTYVSGNENIRVDIFTISRSAKQVFLNRHTAKY